MREVVENQLSETEQQRAKALTRMKWIATGLFVLMAVIFALTFLPQLAFNGILYVRAFSEAAMVGALADWFAVTALFRHPFGIPIPHTAIVPNNKDKIGDSLAGFVERNFLTSKVLEPKLETLNFSKRIGQWIEQPKNSADLSVDLAKLIEWLLGTVDNDAVRQYINKNLRSSSSNIMLAPLVAKILGALTSSNRHQELVDSFVRIGRQQLVSNQFVIRDRINQQSPWWLPKFVDDEIYHKIIGEIARLLDRIGDDPNHPARHSFNQATEDLIESMAHDSETIERAEALKHEILSHPAVQNYISKSWEDIKTYLAAQSSDPASNLHHRLVSALEKFGLALQQDQSMQNQVNKWISTGLMHVVENHNQAIGTVISDTVKSWDTELTTRRVELQVGRDLQFIRINGTLVGGLVGLLIYSIVKAF